MPAAERAQRGAHIVIGKFFSLVEKIPHPPGERVAEPAATARAEAHGTQEAAWSVQFIAGTKGERMTSVAISHDDDSIETALEEALQALDLADLIDGRTVAIKPNDTWATADDTSGVTQADTLRAVVRHVKRLHPRHLIVSGGAGAAETEDVFRISGMLDVVREEGVEFVDHNRGPFQTVSLEYFPDKDVSGPQQDVTINPRILEYDTLISLAQLKLHETATVTLTLKNTAMSFPAADFYGHPRSREEHANCFFADMHSFIVAMARRFPIQVGVIVGHPAMIATGPLGGVAVETGLAIASRDAVATDIVGARLLGFRAQGVRHLWEAGRIGLGETDPSAMQFPLLSLDEAIAIFTKRAYGHELSFQHA